MCWLSSNLVKKVAKHDLIVYKALQPIDDTSARACVFDKFVYHKDKLNDEVEISPRLIRFYEINEGYHSYAAIPDFNRLKWSLEVYRMIIPKGTVYYKSDIYDEIVSGNLIMSERISFEHKLKHLTLSEKIPFILGKIKKFFKLR